MIDLLFASALLAIALLWGLALLPTSIARVLSRLEQLWFAAGLGYGVLSLATLGLGLLGGLHRSAVLAVYGSLTLAAALVVAKRSIIRAHSHLETFPRSLLWPLCLFLVAVNLSAALTPEVRSDPVTYHLSIAMHHADTGRISDLPWQAFSYFPSNQEMLYTLAVLFARDTAAKLVHFTHGVLLVIGIALMTRRFLGARYAPAAALLVLLIPWTGYLSSTCYIELGLAMHELLCLYYVLLALKKEARGTWILAGVHAGFALGTKYVAIPVFLAPLGLALLLQAIRRRDARLLKWHAVAVLASLAVFAPWALRNEALTGNPLFPLFILPLGPVNEHTHELDQWLKLATALPAEVYSSFAAMARWQGTRMGVFSHNAGSYPFLCLAFAALALLLKTALPRPRAPLELTPLLMCYMIFACAGFLFASNNVDGRFLYPVYILMAMFISFWLGGCVDRLRESGRRGLASALIPLVLGVMAVDYANRHLNTMFILRESVFPVLSAKSRDAYYRRHFAWYTGGDRLREMIAPDSVVLGVLYPVRQPWMDWFHGRSDLIGERMADDSPESLARALSELNIGAVVLPNAWPIDEGLMRAAADTHGRLLYSEGGRDFYVLDWERR